jgi:hypothetical protein
MAASQPPLDGERLTAAISDPIGELYSDFYDHDRATATEPGSLGSPVASSQFRSRSRSSRANEARGAHAGAQRAGTSPQFLGGGAMNGSQP